MSIELVLAFTVTVALLCLAPGPDILYVIAHGTAGGRRVGIVAASGVSAGLLGHTIAAAAGLTFLLAAAPRALDLVRILGALMLVYLAVTTWRAAGRGADSGPRSSTENSLRRVFVMATLINLANPKVFVFFIAFLPQFLTTGAAAWPVGLQIALLGLLFIAISFCVDGTAGFVSGTAASALRSTQTFQRWLDRVAACVYLGLAGRLVAQRH